MTTELPIRVEPTRYEVSKYPKGGVNARQFTLWVEIRDHKKDLWCITDGAYCFRRDGHRSYESLPSSRTDRYKKAYRFPKEQALELAQKFVAKMTFPHASKGKTMTAEEMWEWEQSR